MSNLINGYKILTDYNYPFGIFFEEKEDYYGTTKNGNVHHIEPDLPTIKTKELLKSIILKARKLLGKQNIEKLCKIHDIRLEKNHEITTKNNIFETLNNFIESLVNKGGNIIKIMLHNLSHELDLTLLNTVFNNSNRSIFLC